MAFYDIFGIGMALIDNVVTVSNDFLDRNQIHKGIMTPLNDARHAELSETLILDNYHITTQSGGSVCNSLAAAAGFGAKTFFCGKVAADIAGQNFVKELLTYGIDFKNITAVNGSTGECHILITPDADRTLCAFSGVSQQLSIRDIDQSKLLSSKWLYIEGYMLSNEVRTAMLGEVIGMAKQAGVKVSISLSDPVVTKLYLSNFLEVIGEGIDLIFCNKEEALAFAETRDIYEAYERIKYLSKAFVITDGSRETTVYDGQNFLFVTPVANNVVDTNGAGDVFSGAFLYALTSGQNYQSACALANESSARLVEQPGPRLSKNDLKNIKHRLS